MIHSHKHPALGVLLALSSSLLFGLNASTTKVLISSGITAVNITLFRCLAVVAFSGLYLLISNRRMFRIQLREVPFFIIFGVVGVGLMQWAYSNAVANLQVGVALLIEYTAIVIVPIASYFLFREKMRGTIWIAVLLVLGGLSIVAKPWNSTLSPIGVFFGILAAIFLSSYFIMGEHVQRRRDAFSTMFYSFLAASIFWLIASAFLPTASIDFNDYLNLTGNLEAFSLPTWVLLIWVAVFGSFAPMLFTFLALRHLPASGVGIASTAETLFAFVFGFLWLREMIDLSQLIGGALVVVGIVVAQMARSKSWQPSN
ncbi:MAG: DMT family transporter [Micrococcales bacterium]